MDEHNVRGCPIFNPHDYTLEGGAGLYAGREASMERTIDRIDDDITAMEARLERREQMLLEKFSALEQLVSAMNSQSDYLTQQMDNMPSFGGKD